MLRAFVLGLLLLFLSPTTGSTQTPPAAGVSGAFLGERRSPIAGALVALYEQRTGYLVDSTYTDDDGRFSLRPPPMGAYFLVLTKGSLSERVDLTYDGKNVYRTRGSSVSCRDCSSATISSNGRGGRRPRRP